MAEDDPQDTPEQEPTPTQQTKPRGKDERGEPAKPVEIPVPKRSAWERVLSRAARVPDQAGHDEQHSEDQ
jgi:hypothetical protein